MSKAKDWFKDNFERSLTEAYGAKLKGLRSDFKKINFIFFEIEPGLLKAKLIRGKQKPIFIRLEASVWPKPLTLLLKQEFEKQSLWISELLNGGLPEGLQAFVEKFQQSAVPRNFDAWSLKLSDHAARYAENYRAYMLLKLSEVAVTDPLQLLHFWGFDPDVKSGSGAGKESGEKIQLPAKNVIEHVNQQADDFWKTPDCTEKINHAIKAIHGFSNPLFTASKKNRQYSALAKKMDANLQALHVRIHKAFNSDV